MISDVYFPRINGVSTSIETFRSHLAEAGVEVSLVAPVYPGDPGHAPGIWRVPSRRLPFDPEDRLMRWGALQQTVMQQAASGVDLIHVQTPFAAHYAGVGAARHYRVPVVATYHTHFEEYIAHYLPLLPRAWLKAAARRLAASQCRQVDAVIVPSQAMQETLTEYGVSTPRHVLPTGIPLAQFGQGDRAQFRAAHGIGSERPVALFVGRIAHEKNIGFLIEAMSTAVSIRQDLLLVIAGDGPAVPALRQQVSARGLERQVLFVGYLARPQGLADCYAAADVFAFASRTETQGLVLLEAMAAGLPVYALAEMGTRDILAAERGARIAANDASAFGIGLAVLLGKRQQLESMAAEGRRYARDWAAPALAQRLAGLYRSLCYPQAQRDDQREAGQPA
jgi:glycosyltransferase involved in cell wall biosynthesis